VGSVDFVAVEAEEQEQAVAPAAVAVPERAGAAGADKWLSALDAVDAAGVVDGVAVVAGVVDAEAEAAGAVADVAVDAADAVGAAVEERIACAAPPVAQARELASSAAAAAATAEQEREFDASAAEAGAGKPALLPNSRGRNAWQACTGNLLRCYNQLLYSNTRSKHIMCSSKTPKAIECINSFSP